MVLLGGLAIVATSSNMPFHKAIVTTLQTKRRFVVRKGGFGSKNLDQSSFNRSTPWVLLFRIVLLSKFSELDVTCSGLLVSHLEDVTS